MTLGVTGVAAQTIAIRNGKGEQGHGWMFRNRSVCYAVLPRHVAGTRPRITATTAAPVESGTGDVLLPFWDGIDLAIAVLRGGIEARCTAELTDLKPTVTARNAPTAQLYRLTPGGEEERIALRITSRTYLLLEGEVTDGREVFQGTSGAFAFSSGRPIGMAITTDDPSHVDLMRSEEIAMNVERFLSERGAPLSVSEAAVSTEVDGLYLEIARVSVPPVSPNGAPENVLTDEGAYVFPPVRNAEILLRVVGDAPLPVADLRITATPERGLSVPRRFVATTSDHAEPRDFRRWIVDEVPPDGRYTSEPRAVRLARWVRIVIASTWGEGDIRVERIAVGGPPG